MPEKAACPPLIFQGWRPPSKGRGSSVLSWLGTFQEPSPPSTAPHSWWERDSDSDNFVDSALTPFLGGVGISILFR